MSTNTHGLSRKEHLLVKIRNGQRFNLEEMRWAAELLSDSQLDLAFEAGCFGEVPAA